MGKIIVKAIEKKKVLTLEALDVQELTTLADLFIIAVADNVKQVKAMADIVEEDMEAYGYYPIHKEGYHTATWILLDYNEVIVHILARDYAEFYGIERLWKDAPKIEYDKEQA